MNGVANAILSINRLTQALLLFYQTSTTLQFERGRANK